MHLIGCCRSDRWSLYLIGSRLPLIEIKNRNQRINSLAALQTERNEKIEMAQRCIEETVAAKLRRQKYFRTELFAVVVVLLFCTEDRWLR